MTAAPHMRVEVDVPSGLAQRGEIGNGGFGAWQDHKCSVAPNGVSRFDEGEFHAGFKPPRINVIKIGDARIGEYDDQATVALSATPADQEGEGVFRRQPAGSL